MVFNNNIKYKSVNKILSFGHFESFFVWRHVLSKSKSLTTESKSKSAKNRTRVQVQDSSPTTLVQTAHTFNMWHTTTIVIFSSYLCQTNEIIKTMCSELSKVESSSRFSSSVRNEWLAASVATDLLKQYHYRNYNEVNRKLTFVWRSWLIRMEKTQQY